MTLFRSAGENRSDKGQTECDDKNDSHAFHGDFLRFGVFRLLIDFYTSARSISSRFTSNSYLIDNQQFYG
jgi:hypothetical protein